MFVFSLWYSVRENGRLSNEFVPTSSSLPVTSQGMCEAEGMLTGRLVTAFVISEINSFGLNQFVQIP